MTAAVAAGLLPLWSELDMRRGEGRGARSTAAAADPKKLFCQRVLQSRGLTMCVVLKVLTRLSWLAVMVQGACSMGS